MATLKRALKVTLAGRGVATIRPSDHVATGGEGSVYRLGNTAIKLFTDPDYAVRAGLEEKITLLSQLQSPYIVAPKGLVYGEGRKAIGYHMEWNSGDPLVKVFTSEYWQKEGFTTALANDLVSRMRETVLSAHGAHALMVDANELNWLAEKEHGGVLPHVIDVDSWSVGRFKPHVIMPSIRDWHTNGFTEGTDWFAFGVVSFQVYAGIHPYKGKVDGYAPYDLESRMRDKVSVFRTNVRLNRAVRDFSGIPRRLYDWYRAVFEGTERTVPPVPQGRGVEVPDAARTLRVKQTGEGNLIFEKIMGEEDSVQRIFPCGVAMRKSGALFDIRSKRGLGIHASASGAEVVEVDRGFLVADRHAGVSRLRFVNRVSFEISTLPVQAAGQWFRAGNRLFDVSHSRITEIDFRMLGKPMVTLGNGWGVLGKATEWFDGVGVQDAMGAMFLVVPVLPKGLAQVRIPELDQRRVIAATAGDRFVALVTINKAGQYQKLECTFDTLYHNYSSWETNIDQATLNTAILPNGVTASINQDQLLTIYVPRNGTVNNVSDSFVGMDMRLWHMGTTVLATRRGAVWSIRMQ